MRFFSRAAAFAAALSAVVLTAFSSPSQAMNFASIPLAAHNLANVTADQQLPDPVEAPVVAPQTDFSSPPATPPVVTTPALPEAPRTLSQLVDHHLDTARVTDSEIECLAGAIYFESKGEPLEGQLAVAEVVINRSESGKYPSSLCGVVKQRNQFSFIRGGRFPPIAKASASWHKAVAIAHIALKDLADSRASDALFFHAKYVRPGWRGLTRVASVGNHIFYR